MKKEDRDQIIDGVVELFTRGIKHFSQMRGQEPEEETDGIAYAYAILGATPSTPLSLLKDLYELKRKAYHPDTKATGDDEAFKAVQDAWEVIEASKVLERAKRWRQ